jgi:hypothetical protein
MSWSHEDSWEVRLVLEALETLERNSESVNFETGEVSHGVSFTRERSIPRFHRAAGRRFDFSVLVDCAERKREFLIEVHGKQHYEFSFLGDEVGESDRLKKEWAEMQKIALLVLSQSEVLALAYSDSGSDGLTARITKFLRIKETRKPIQGKA